MKSKAERLEKAGEIASVVRLAAERDRERRVGIVDKDGKVVRYESLPNVRAKVLERAGLEIATEGARPARVVCECGAVVRVKRKGRVPKRCGRCSQRICAKSWRKRNIERARARDREEAKKRRRARGGHNKIVMLECLSCGGNLEARGGARPRYCLPCREKRARQQRAEWQRRNRERVNDRNRSRYAASREASRAKAREKMRKYTEKNRERLNAAKRSRRAKKRRA